MQLEGVCLFVFEDVFLRNRPDLIHSFFHDLRHNNDDDHRICHHKSPHRQLLAAAVPSRISSHVHSFEASSTVHCARHVVLMRLDILLQNKMCIWSVTHDC